MLDLLVKKKLKEWLMKLMLIKNQIQKENNMLKRKMFYKHNYLIVNHSGKMLLVIKIKNLLNNIQMKYHYKEKIKNNIKINQMSIIYILNI